MNVAHVIEAMHTGGAESLVIEHARRAGSGVRTLVVALNRGGPAMDLAREAGARVELLGKGRARLSAIGRLRGLLREHGTDVVNAHNPVGAFYGTVAARLAGVPAVVRTEHSIHYPGRGGRLYQTIEPWLTRATDRVICVCEASRRSLAPSDARVARRFVTVYNGISDAPPTAPAARVRDGLGLREGERFVLTVGSLTPQKSQDVLLDAFARLAGRAPGARLFVAGEGRLESELRAHHARLGLGERVVFLGARQDVADLVAACDLFVLSSSREGLSVTLLEAMRAGRACVATDVGGNAEAVEHGVTGRIARAGDPEALADALADALASREALETAGRAGRARWERLFTAERMVRETERLYGDVLRARGHTAPEVARAVR